LLERLVDRRAELLPTVVLHQYDARVVDEAHVLERRVLSSVRLTFSDAARTSLVVYNTHLHAEPGAAGLDVRYAEMQTICKHLGRGSTGVATSPSDAHAAGHASPTRSCSSFVLCGDLNACSERDYTPGEQYMMYAFSGLHMPEEHNYWAVLEQVEAQLAIDSFALAQAARPKISCWSCRRVDHILLSTQAALQWRVDSSVVYYTLASDHLPIVCWMRREQAQVQEPTRCPGR
jgi:endonuclease/exonuclease/phosphatase family metal-dependent hydrolase